MGIQRIGGIERVLQRIFVPLFLIAGIIVAGGFFFPEGVGAAVPDRWWLVIALIFFGSGLGYLAVLPTKIDEYDDIQDVNYLLRVRRVDVTESVKRFQIGVDSITFAVPMVALLVFFIVQLVARDQLAMAIEVIQRFLTLQMGWIFGGVMGISLLFCLYLVSSKWGEIRLGGPDAEPTYTLPVYFTMFFTAGIAAGIVFSSFAEPVTHYGEPPPLFGVQAESADAIDASLTYSLFHWGFTAWSAYIVLGLPIAYFVYQQNAPLRVSAILTPFLGADNLSSPLAKLVDILAIFATIGGIATSVAMVSQQFLAGVGFQWAVESAFLGPLLFVGGLTFIFVLSAQSGVHRGIRRIAVVNMVLFTLFGLLLLAIGPQGAITTASASAVEGYLLHFIPMSMQSGSEWVAGWTMWNWAWWFSWAPFAGLFLAALSRGRQIRTVVLTGVGATGLATIIWFLIIGSTTLEIEHRGDGGILSAIETHEGGAAVAGFPVFESLPLSELLIFLFLGLIVMFMTTSADTSTLVVAILATRAEAAPTTSVIVFWGIVQGIVAVFVLITGTEALLQGLAVLTGGPFALLAIVAIVGLLMGFREFDGDIRSPLLRLWDIVPEQPEFDQPPKK